MPAYFATHPFHLAKLPLTTKVGLSGFYLAILAALGFSVYPLFGERTGFTARGVRENFVGVNLDSLSEEEQERLLAEARAQGRPIPAQKSPRQRIEIVHPHSFLVPILYFILVHLMEMTATPRGLRVALYVASFAAMAFAIFAPVILPAAPGLAPVLLASLFLLWGTFGAMVVVPAAQMWFGRAA